MATVVETDYIRDANVRYHDLAAQHYDVKWGVDYGPAGQGQVTGKLRKALGLSHLGYFADALEIGAGTGYFGLNLVQAGAVGSYTATDISSGMIDALEASADRMDISARTECCEASELPFPDDSFDLVFGHAVLHHLPDLQGSLREFLRVLKPGGAIAFCGEPSHYGDRIASVPKRAAYRAAPAWRALMGAAPAKHEGFHHTPAEDQLERIVDVHAFTPSMLRDSADAAGLQQVLVRGEELAASIFGWANRALEATAEPSDVPWLWRQYAYRGYLAFQALDRALLEPRLPAAIFYNLLISGRAPV
jgi:SAM-dependent methyltransferase